MSVAGLVAWSGYSRDVGVRLTKTQTAHDEKWDKIVNCALFIYQQHKINKLKSKIRQTRLLKYHHDYSTKIAVWLLTTDWCFEFFICTL